MSEKKSDLAREQCVECTGSEPAMALPEAKRLLAELHEAWSINGAGHLERAYLLKNFAESLALANKIGVIAERAGHHPDLVISYGRMLAEVWTHKINGLSRADFVLAAKIDEATKDRDGKDV